MRPKKRNDLRRRSRNTGLKRIGALSIGALCLASLAGFFLFLTQIYAASDPTPTQVDAIVALSGHPRRIRVATQLLKQGYSRRLIIVGQDNRDEVVKIRSAEPSLFNCCVKVDHGSKNTVNDALLVRQLIQRMPTHSILLVTSSFHMPRAKNELSRVLPGIKIIPYGVSDDAYDIRKIFSDKNITSKFIAQYFKFVSSSMLGSRAILVEQDAKRVVEFLSNVRNIVLIVAAAASSFLALFALSKHRQRKRTFSRRVDSRSPRSPPNKHN